MLSATSLHNQLGEEGRSGEEHRLQIGGNGMNNILRIRISFNLFIERREMNNKMQNKEL